jgi:hypothetical protein
MGEVGAGDGAGGSPDGPLQNTGRNSAGDGR